MAQTVLVADDSIASQRLFEMVLTREGYNVITVGSGKEVLERVKEKNPDLALIDAIMPGADGYQICQMLKQDPKFKHLPVIMLAGKYEAFDQKRGAKIVGTNAILNKPSKSHEIASKVKEFLALQEQRQREQAESELVSTEAQAITEIEQLPKTEEYPEVIQEPTFVQEEYEFDEDSEETDLVVESEILDEEAEWEEIEEEEEEEILPPEEYEEELSVPLLGEEEEMAIEEEEMAEVTAPPVSPVSSLEQLTLSEENLDLIAEEIAKRLTGKLAPVLMQSLTTYLLQIPAVKHVVENTSKTLVKEILPEIREKLLT
jgi:CheY-like chemotaxis protein